MFHIINYMKICTICKKQKNTEDFYKNKTKCKDKIFLSLHGKCKDCYKNKRNERHERNKEIENLRSREYNNSNKDKIKIVSSVWRENIKNKYGVNLSSLYNYGFETCLKVFDLYKRECKICKKTYNLSIHHKDKKGINNFKKTGEPMNNNIDNLELICRNCHQSLHIKEYWENKKLSKN